MIPINFSLPSSIVTSVLAHLVFNYTYIIHVGTIKGCRMSRVRLFTKDYQLDGTAIQSQSVGELAEPVLYNICGGQRNWECLTFNLTIGEKYYETELKHVQKNSVITRCKNWRRGCRALHKLAPAPKFITCEENAEFQSTGKSRHNIN